jgi:hypothetical protein
MNLVRCGTVRYYKLRSLWYLPPGTLGCFTETVCYVMFTVSVIIRVDN